MDLAVAVSTVVEMEALVRDLALAGYPSVAIVEHEVREMLALITTRGFDRGQDLAHKLEELIAAAHASTA